MEKKRPHVGVGVVVLKDDQLLLGKRKNPPGKNEWSLVGGHLEFGETIEECASRELFEEVGLKAKSIRTSTLWKNQRFTEEDCHYITLYAFVDEWEGDVQLKEPTKCAEWSWFNWDNLPKPHFPSIPELRAEAFNRHDPKQLLEGLLALFRERDWEQFHSPKNLVMDLASEVGELLDLFRWLTEEQSYQPATLTQIRDEIGDVFTALLYLSHKLSIDPVSAGYQKLHKLAQRYPAALSRGRIDKYTSYCQNQRDD